MLYDDSDQLFASWMIERLEKLRFSVFDPNRDMRIGMIEHANNIDIISRRCEQVILICSNAIFHSKNKRFLTDIAVQTRMNKDGREKYFILPVIYKNETIKNMPEAVNMISKAKYLPPNKSIGKLWCSNKLVILQRVLEASNQRLKMN